MIILGVGSSIGDAVSVFSCAKNLLHHRGVFVTRSSFLYENSAYGGVAKNIFTNAVWQVQTALSPHALLRVLQAVENALGRTRHTRWDDRTLDLDILWYDQVSYTTETLTLPHPEIEKRDFVLIPLRDLLGDNYALPSGKTITEAMNVLPLR